MRVDYLLELHIELPRARSLLDQTTVLVSESDPQLDHFKLVDVKSDQLILIVLTCQLSNTYIVHFAWHKYGSREFSVLKNSQSHVS